MADSPDQPPAPAPADPFDAAWREVEGQWGDDAAHRRFIAFCASMGALDQAGRRYRMVRDSDPARADEARRRIDAVLGAAMQHMDLTRSARPNPTRRIQWVAFGLSLFFVLYALLSVLRGRPQ